MPDDTPVMYHPEMERRPSTASKRIALLATAALVLSWTAIFIRLAAAEHAPSLIIAVNRLALASALLGIYVLFFQRKSFAGFGWSAFIPAACAGVLFGFHVFTFILSLSYTTVANATLLLSVLPIFAAILGRLFFKEKPHPWSYAAILLTIAGALLVLWGDLRWQSEHVQGDLIALVCALLGSLYFLMRRLVPKDQRPSFFPYILTVYTVSCLVLSVVVVVSGQAGQALNHSARIWFWLFMLALCCTVVGHSLYNKALDFFPAHVVGSWILTEPILAATLAWVFLGEAFQWQILWGVPPIYAGVAWVLWLERNG